MGRGSTEIQGQKHRHSKRKKSQHDNVCFDSSHLSKALLNATSSLKNLLIRSELILSSLTRPLFCTSVITISPLFYHFLCGSAGKEYTWNVGDLGLIPGLGRLRSPGKGKGSPLQYFGLENSMDYTVHRITKSQTWLTDFHTHTHTNSLGLLPLNKLHQSCSYMFHIVANCPV